LIPRPLNRPRTEGSRERSVSLSSERRDESYPYRATHEVIALTMKARLNAAIS